MRLPRGMTLVELLVVLAVIGILLGLGVPAWSAMMRANQLATATNNLVAAITLARVEAVRSGHRATFCASLDGVTCTTLGYHHGWIVFRDTDGDTYRDPNEPILASGGPVEGVSIHGNHPVVRMISYTPLGQPKTAGGAFQAGSLFVCKGRYGRRLVLSPAGRLRIEHTACS